MALLAALKNLFDQAISKIFLGRRASMFFSGVKSERIYVSASSITKHDLSKPTSYSIAQKQPQNTPRDNIQPHENQEAKCKAHV
jgi:hypothetical protein